MEPSTRQDAVIAAHLAELGWRNYSQGTIDQRRRALARLARHAGHPVVDCTTDQVLAALDRRQLDGSPLKASSRSTEIAHLAAFYKWAVLNDHIERDPMLRVPRPRLPRWLPHPISEPSLAMALTLAPLRVRPWLFLAAFAGLRACEIAALRADDLRWDADPPVILIRSGKGGDPGLVPIAPVLDPLLRALPPRGYLFLRLDGRLGPLAGHNISHGANNFLHQLGLNDTLHSLRHRFGTQVYRASGRDLRQTQELMRHRSIVSTAVYTQVDQSEAAGIVSALPVAASA